MGILINILAIDIRFKNLLDVVAGQMILVLSLLELF